MATKFWKKINHGAFVRCLRKWPISECGRQCFYYLLIFPLQLHLLLFLFLLLFLLLYLLLPSSGDNAKIGIWSGTAPGNENLNKKVNVTDNGRICGKNNRKPTSDFLQYVSMVFKGNWLRGVRRIQLRWWRGKWYNEGCIWIGGRQVEEYGEVWREVVTMIDVDLFLIFKRQDISIIERHLHLGLQYVLLCNNDDSTWIYST